MKKIYVIALNTFRESMRGKVLYSVLFFAIILVAVSSLFGSVTIGDQSKVIKDFGLFAVSICSVAFAVISGTSLLYKELSRKTIYNILSKAVYRWQFLAGKYIGMLITAVTLLMMMGGAFMLYLFFFEGRFDPLIFDALIYNVLELVIVCAAAIFFSAIVVTPLLSGLFTFGIFLAGRSTPYFLYFVEHGDVTGAVAWILKTLNLVLPNLDKLNISNEVVYADNNAINSIRLLWSAVYAVCYAGALLLLANFIFRRRDFN